MLTLKLKNESTGRTKILSCDDVEIVPNGREVKISLLKSDKREHYVIGNGEFTVGFVESNGVTSQIVRPPR